MKSLRLSIILFTIGLAVFFNLERVDLGEENIIDIDSFVYIISLVAVVSVIWIPGLRRSNVFVSGTLWISIYLIGKLILFMFFERRPLFGGLYSYLSITEVALLFITIWLSHRIAFALNDFEDAVEKITFTNTNKRIRQIEEATDEIQLEMFRSRHYHHPLSIVIVKPKPGFIKTALHQAIQEAQQAMMNTYIINTMAQTFSKYIRQTDLILEQRDKERFIILCPDTTATDLDLLIEYMQTVAGEQLGASVMCGAATFPDEAVTFEELMYKAELQLQKRTDNNGSGPS